jgi:4-methylaminobutanoate oxidase (formaldehyde-forming)
VVSAAWGATLGGSVGTAYLWTGDGSPVDLDWVRAGDYEVDLAGTRWPVRVSTRPLYDPDGASIRA